MKKRMASAIDFGTSKIVCVIGQQCPTGALEVLSMGQSEYDGIRRGAFVNAAKVGPALRRAIGIAQDRAHLRIRRTAVGVPGAFVHAGLVRGDAPVRQKDKRVSMGDMRAAIRAAERFEMPKELELLHSVAQSYQLDGGTALRKPQGIKASVIRAKVSCVLGERAFSQKVQEILGELHIEVPQFIAIPYVLPLYAIPERERENTAVLLDVGAWSTDICIVKNGALSWHSLLKVGGENITNDLAQGLDVPREQAIQIKKRYVFGLETQAGSGVHPDSRGVQAFSYETIQEIVEARVEELCALVRKELGESKVPLSTRSNVYITGGGLATMRGSREFVEARLQMPARIFQPDVSMMHAPYYSSAVSILHHLFTESEIEGASLRGSRIGLIDRIKRTLNNQGGN